MSIAEWRRTLIARIVDGPGEAPVAQRRAAFENGSLAGPLKTLANKVALAPARVTDADIAAVRAAGLGDDQIFDLVVCAAVGQADRQYETARAALAVAAAGH
jgi:hypothetical protein